MKNYQELFHRSQHGRYLLTHSIGLMPRSTEQALDDNYLQHWRSGAEDIWSHWLAGVNQFNQSLANLMHSEASQFCPQSNVSSGLSKVLMALPKKPGKNVILATESDFPSVGFVLQQAERLGFKLRLIPKIADLQALDTWEQALSDDVHTTFITQVHYNTNMLTPVEQIAEVCRARGIISIVDTAQATGIVPIDLSNSNCDILVGSCIKWLCGGPGAGFVWFNADLIEHLKPYDVGWFSHQNPFEFDIHNFEYADNAARFWGGTPSVAPYIAASNSIDLIADIGIQAVVEHNLTLTRRLLEAVPENCIVSPLDLNKKGGTTVLKFDQQAKLEDSMRANKLLFDSRQYGMRLSPHIYSDKSDIDCLVDCIQEHLN
jgi:kynureninase